MKEIRDLSKLLNTQIMHPESLVQNMHLDNYSEIRYFKKSNFLIAEIKCELQNEAQKVFFYYFSNEALEKITILTPIGEDEIFNRLEEAKKLRMDIREKLQKKSKEAV